MRHWRGDTSSIGPRCREALGVEDAVPEHIFAGTSFGL
jgi:hypothetical protein